MNKYELAAKVSKYVAIVSAIFLIGHFGLNVSLTKE